MVAIIDSFKDNEKIVVLVTGASGYIALHCVQQLLENGYTVRGTVRSLQNSSKISPLRDLKYSSERLELVEADLECPDHWPKAIKGCTYIMHIASPWPIVADETTIRIAKNGTLNVLKAATQCSTVQKIVLTSSTAAINDGHKNDARVFDENCWGNLNSKQIENYSRSKIIAEKAAWEFWKSLPEASRFQLTVLNPSFVIGPVLSDQRHGSAKIIRRMMDYHTFPAAPKVSLGMVDVRDVARAHIRAMECANCNGERILITATPSVWFSQLTRWLHDEFKSFLISRVTTPNWLAKLYAKMTYDPHFEAVKYRLGAKLHFDNTKLLQMEYMPIKKSVIDMVYSMPDYGIVVRKKNLEKTKNVPLLFKLLKMFEEEEPGKPKNWGYTITIITLVMLLNITVITICRILLDSHDENNHYWLEAKVRENLILFLGIFAMSFCFYCCCCFCCGGSLCRWITKWYSKCFDPSNLLSTAIKTVEEAPATHKKRKNPFFVFNVSNDGDCMMPYAYTNGAFTNSSEHRSIFNNSKGILIPNEKKLANYSKFKCQSQRRKSL
uniref:NAD-dependent epimerase/dehydratase domain-containing protein n=1 Tax=Wuchereria bancrofti TaxID=6293 RepID=A0AAF5PLM8_WUCBA